MICPFQMTFPMESSEQCYFTCTVFEWSRNGLRYFCLFKNSVWSLELEMVESEVEIFLYFDSKAICGHNVVIINQYELFYISAPSLHFPSLFVLGDVSGS